MPRAELTALSLALIAIALLTAGYAQLGITNQTTVALSLLLVVLIAAAVSTRRVAVAASLLAFVCFNYFFLPPVGTLSIADPDNLVALFTLLAVSVVASHLSAEARRRARDAAAAELKSMLLASFSHDLKTPLTAVTIAASNLDAAWLTEEERHEQLAIIRTELARLNRLFADMIDLARIETKAVAAEREWVDPAEIVEAAARQVDRALAAHKLEVDGGRERAHVRVDPRLTAAALAHLLENAAQYSPVGSTIAVTIMMSDGFRISVRDRGAGIAPADLNRVFERFYRGGEGRQRRFGTGVGLAITRGLLAAEGGRVWAENHPDGGAVFTISVPTEVRNSAEPDGEGV